ncbi:hypothetical protein PTSG_09530 [Salpingoeca rosetta]|uniref:Uncharacterized protein n=1 Tax=Salpingoeca rosetta (strain ATCC 50818 / BSB-021) TaxID=946362 RepID=F2UL96_SALR5|nr:uncharacterized protein PTSG_09530 [Salpingoeca rosetta]EGD77895.1 hypothetical protein PTSG_09530 [Salpingoeca rosetta]|eukprot:XP_004989959.1 hypothetical protein PTSG_09530 [Salpingoeca rosetta]
MEHGSREAGRPRAMAASASLRIHSNDDNHEDAVVVSVEPQESTPQPEATTASSTTMNSGGGSTATSTGPRSCCHASNGQPPQMEGSSITTPATNDAAASTAPHRLQGLVQLDRSFVELEHTSCTDTNPVNTLLRACREGNLAEVEQLLITHGCGLLQSATNEHTCPLAEAALSGKRIVCEVVIAQDRDQLAWTNASNETVLFNAALGGSVDVFSLLVSEGSLNCTHRNTQGTSPIFFAAARGKLDIVRWICRHARGVLRHTNDQRESFASVACKKGRMNIVEWLVSKKVDLSNFHIASESPFLVACRAGRHDVVTFLLERNVSLEPHRSAFTDEASNALAACAMGGHDDLVALFLEKHVFTVQSYVEALNKAVTSNFPHIALQIFNAIDAGKIHHPFDFAGHTLGVLIRHGHPRHAARLLQQHDKHERFAQGLVQFLIPAVRSGRLDMVKWVVSTDIARRETGAAAAVQMMRRLSIRGRPAKYQSPSARELAAALAGCEHMPAIVHEGLKEARFHLVKWLTITLRLPASAFIWERGTALHMAAAAGHTEAAFFFAEHMHLPADKPDVNGNRPLHLAARAGATAIVRLLLVSGADLAARNKADRQPLGMALLHDRDLTAHVLREAPSLTPVHVALAGHMHGLLADRLRRGVLNPETALNDPAFGAAMPTFVQLARNMIRAPPLAMSNVNDRLEALLRSNNDNDDGGGGVDDGDGESGSSGSEGDGDGGDYVHDIDADDDDDGDDDGSADALASETSSAIGGASGGGGDEAIVHHHVTSLFAQPIPSIASASSSSSSSSSSSAHAPTPTTTPTTTPALTAASTASSLPQPSQQQQQQQQQQQRTLRRRRKKKKRAVPGPLADGTMVPTTITRTELLRGGGGGYDATVLPALDAPVSVTLLGASQGPLPRRVCVDVLRTLNMAINISRPWNPSNHRLFPTAYRHLVFKLLLCFMHERFSDVPQEHVFAIIKHMTRAAIQQ